MNLLYEEKTDYYYIEKQYNSAIFYSPLCRKKLFYDRYILEKNGDFQSA